ncbi:Uncharacterised protein [BD1-7 clade bacterium]|uniref:Uncharacterized protein n=1 Tax=BD1-7 clade bacterium TaxID=2029982 RepID=A0A5S9QRF4_9GAMM|nr:Uncharacterised protein [BD1-7 clade bacterium]
MLSRFCRSKKVEKNKSTYTPMTKHYVFNETGNIMLCATTDSIADFDKDVKDAFMDVSVFFAAMAKALSTTTNPITQKPYSTYNYQAVKDVLTQSGMFIEMNVEEGLFRSHDVGASMGKELVQTVLNRDFSDTNLAFSHSMFNGMAYQQKLATDSGASNKPKLCRSGNIFFVCEMLMGLPQTTAILVNLEPQSVDKQTNQQGQSEQDIFSVGLWDDSQHQSEGLTRSWKYKKRTYLFVPPKLFNNNFDAFMDHASPEFMDFTRSISDRLNRLAEQHSDNVPE